MKFLKETLSGHSGIEAHDVVALLAFRNTNAEHPELLHKPKISDWLEKSMNGGKWAPKKHHKLTNIHTLNTLGRVNTKS